MYVTSIHLGCRGFQGFPKLLPGLREAYMVGQRRISLIDEVGIYITGKQRTYHDMFQMAVVSRKSLPLAHECALKAVEGWELMIGGSNKGGLNRLIGGFNRCY
jgi:hypothetical protein